MNDDVLDRARSHESLRPFAEALERQTRELEASFRTLGELGDATLQASQESLSEIEDACRCREESASRVFGGLRC